MSLRYFEFEFETNDFLLEELPSVVEMNQLAAEGELIIRDELEKCGMAKRSNPFEYEKIARSVAVR